MNTHTAPTVTKATKKSLHTLGNIFHYLEGTILMVELKTGQCHLGKLLSSTSDMNLILVDVIVISPRDRHLPQYMGNNYKLVQHYHQIIALQPQETQEDQSNSSKSNRETTGNSSSIERNNTVHPLIPATTNDPQQPTATTTAARITNTTHTTPPLPPILQLVHIRGSKIRYIHFIDHNNSNDKNTTILHLVQVGMHRERVAKQQYQRGVRK